MRWIMAVLGVLLGSAGTAASGDKAFEILLSTEISRDPAGHHRRYVVIDGGYSEGLLEGMTIVVPGNDQKAEPIARLTIERVEANESYCEALALEIAGSGGLLRAFAEHGAVTFETDPFDTVTLQKRAIEAFAAADYRRAHFYLSTLIETGAANPSIHSTFWHLENRLFSDSLPVLSPDEREQEELMLPIYEHLAAHYYTECRFDRVMGVLYLIERVSPDHFALPQYWQTLSVLAEVLPDSLWLFLGERRFQRYDPNQAVLLYAPEPEIADTLPPRPATIEASLRCLVNGQGAVLTVKVDQSSGSIPVDQALVDAASQTIWRPPLWANDKWGYYPGAGFGTWEVRIDKSE